MTHIFIYHKRSVLTHISPPGLPLTLLPQDAGDASPACLDGSPYGFYFRPSKTNSTKWTISIEGGGWCYDEQECYSRSKMALGSSKGWSKTGGCGCMNTKDDPSGLDNDCNCLYMPYGDGASFSGYVSARTQSALSDTCVGFFRLRECAHAIRALSWAAVA